MSTFYLLALSSGAEEVGKSVWIFELVTFEAAISPRAHLFNVRKFEHRGTTLLPNLDPLFA